MALDVAALAVVLIADAYLLPTRFGPWPRVLAAVDCVAAKAVVQRP